MNPIEPKEPTGNLDETPASSLDSEFWMAKSIIQQINCTIGLVNAVIDRHGPQDYDVAIGRKLATRLRSVLTHTMLRYGVPTAFAIMLATSPVMAQSEMAETMCSSDGYNFLIAVIYLIVGLVSASIVGAIFLGGGMKAFGWVARSVSAAGNKALVYSGAAFALIALVMVMTGVAYTTLPAEAPTQCVTFF